jgi:MoaA/NifB/PqqE/SkfB family radical SAM enzyme/predicted hotdog family 3-hydroxylacyl-ACP dehydratase
VRGDCSVRIGGLGFSPEEIEQCVQRTGLLAVEFDLSTPGKCRCAACQQSPDRPRDVMSIEEIHGVLDQAKNIGSRRCLLFDSEPESYPGLSELVEHVRGTGMQIELFTDAVITASTARSLRNRDVAVVISLNSDSLEHLKRAGYGESGSPRLAVRIEICEENLSDIPNLWRWVRTQNCEPYVQIITPRPNGRGELKFVEAQRSRQLFEELGRIDREEFGKQWDAPPSLTGRSCKRHLFACHVTPCGTIFACVGVTIPLGNVRSEPLVEILNLSEVLENLRAYGQMVKEPCRTCCQSVDCYGCRGAAYQLTGDYLAGDQLCWKAEGVGLESLPFETAALISHGPSMRAIQQLVQIGERTGRTQFVVPADSPLVDASGRLDELAYIEMIAQSFAACHGFHLSGEQRKVHRGLLLGIKDLSVTGQARAGDRLTVVVRKITRFGDFGVVEGDVLGEDGKLIATGQIKIWRLNSEFLQTTLSS